MSSSTSNTSLKPLPYVEEYIRFQSDGKSDHLDQCAKSRTSMKVVDLILDIESF